MADHELNANDTEPPWEGHLDYLDAPALIAGQPNPDIPPLVGDETLTWVQKLTTSPATVLTGTIEVVNATTRHVRHRFTKPQSAVAGDWEFTVQIDYPDARRHTHPLGEPSTLKIWPDLGGPST